MKGAVSVIVFLCLTAVVYAADKSQRDVVERIFGRQGVVQDGMIKMTFARSDLNIKFGDTPVKPGLGLTSWAAFANSGTKAVMMGDLVLTASEVMPVIKKLTEEGIGITALHNHIIGTSREIMYLHFSAKGDRQKLANALRSALSFTSTPLTETHTAQEEPQAVAGFQAIQSVLGRGKEKGGILQYSFPREERITENGVEVPPFMGTANAINFEMFGDKAATTGDFVLTAGEVNPVIKALAENGITITAVHNHMLTETPRLFFLHFWGQDAPEKLSKGIKTALDQVNLKKGNE